jgi:hypothetical protein
MVPALAIVPNDGSLRIEGCPVVICRNLSREEAAAGLSQFYRSQTDHGNGYEWLVFGGVSFGGRPCGFSLCFHRGRLTQVHWGVSLPNAPQAGGWPTREAIDAEIAFVRGILQQSLGRSFVSGEERFPWGIVWATFDSKGFQASAGVRYRC